MPTLKYVSSLQDGVTFHAGNSQYSSASADARQYIIDTFGWSIIDGGTTSVGATTTSATSSSSEMTSSVESTPRTTSSSTEAITSYGLGVLSSLLIISLILYYRRQTK